MIRSLTVILSLTGMLSCCTLTWRKKAARDAEGNKSDHETSYRQAVEKANVRSDLQLTNLALADRLAATAFYGLFSEGGYIDGGQFAVFLMADGTGRLDKTEPGAASTKTIELSKAQLDGFASYIKEFANLKDYSRPSFDGIRHEFVVFSRQNHNDALELVQRTFIMTLQEGNDTEPYSKLMSTFFDLAK